MKEVASISFYVEGENATQGSFNNYGVGKLVPVNHKELTAWRLKIAQAFQDNGIDTLKDCNIFSMRCVFLFEAPKVRQKRALAWCENAPIGMPFMPRNVGKDGDKMLRSVCDSFSLSTAPELNKKTKAKEGINDSKFYKLITEKYEFPIGLQNEGVHIEIKGYKI